MKFFFDSRHFYRHVVQKRYAAIISSRGEAADIGNILPDAGRKNKIFTPNVHRRGVPQKP